MGRLVDTKCCTADNRHSLFGKVGAQRTCLLDSMLRGGPGAYDRDRRASHLRKRRLSPEPQTEGHTASILLRPAFRQTGELGGPFIISWDDEPDALSFGLLELGCRVDLCHRPLRHLAPRPAAEPTTDQVDDRCRSKVSD
ncbi:MAG: hypothetical protein L0H93_08460 [Nocardioides sp.]|nr:hypothetical protein [Nocardioides sp.]